MKKAIHWLDEYLEEFLMVVFLIAMTLIMGIQVFSRYILGVSLSWSEEITRYLFIWSAFLSVSLCTKKCISIKIDQFIQLFPRRGKSLFKVLNLTVEFVFFVYLIPYAFLYLKATMVCRCIMCSLLRLSVLSSRHSVLPSVGLASGGSC